MGRDNHPRERQARQLARKQGRREPFDRVLIVCEGSKTEPLYFEELRAYYRLNTANVVVQHSQYGTSPLQVVEFARDRLLTGDPHTRLPPGAFDRVYAVFDRDQHESYHAALALAQTLDGKLKNDDKKAVRFEAIASVPCFELWLLLHFEDVHAPLDRNEAFSQLRTHLAAYEKGSGGHFEQTRMKLGDALGRAQKLATLHSREDGRAPLTDVAKLVEWLVSIKPLG